MRAKGLHARGLCSSLRSIAYRRARAVRQCASCCTPPRGRVRMPCECGVSGLLRAADWQVQPGGHTLFRRLDTHACAKHGSLPLGKLIRPTRVYAADMRESNKERGSVDRPSCFDVCRVVHSVGPRCPPLVAHPSRCPSQRGDSQKSASAHDRALYIVSLSSSSRSQSECCAPSRLGHTRPGRPNRTREDGRA